MDRNARVRVMHAIETMERITKQPGCRNGCLGLPAVAILRALMFKFANRTTGLCFPSYDAIMDATGLCRASIAKGLKNLEACGVLAITRGRTELWYRCGRLLPRKPCNRYAFRDVQHYFVPKFAAKDPIRALVHRANRNQTVRNPEPLWWMQQGSEVGSAIRKSDDWRDRARQLLIRACNKA